MRGFLRVQCGKRILQAVFLGFESIYARFPGGQLRVKAFCLLFAFRALRLHALDVALRVFDVRTQHGDAALLLGGVSLALAQRSTQRVDFAVDFVQLAGQTVRAAVQLLLRGFRLLKLRPAGFGVPGQLVRVGFQPVQLPQPERHLEHTQFAFEGEILLGLFGLAFERFQLARQLIVEVADAREVFLGRGEAALRLLLANAEFGDAGGLLENFAAVLAFEGEDLVNAALPDARIAVAAEAGVHEQLTDVLEAAVLFAEVVFALARAVVAARHHDFSEGRTENAGGVV